MILTVDTVVDLKAWAPNYATAIRNASGISGDAISISTIPLEISGVDSLTDWFRRNGTLINGRYSISPDAAADLQSDIDLILGERDSDTRHQRASFVGLMPNDGKFTQWYYINLGRVQKVLRNCPLAGTIWATFDDEPQTATVADLAKLEKLSLVLQTIRNICILSGEASWGEVFNNLNKAVVDILGG